MDYRIEEYWFGFIIVDAKSGVALTAAKPTLKLAEIDKKELIDNWKLISGQFEENKKCKHFKM